MNIFLYFQVNQHTCNQCLLRTYNSWWFSKVIKIAKELANLFEFVNILYDIYLSSFNNYFK